MSELQRDNSDIFVSQHSQRSTSFSSEITVRARTRTDTHTPDWLLYLVH